jgi:growth hormone-inducible transmembrane protein
MILPAHYLRTLAATEAMSLYGGLAVFSGFVLWDTQKVLQHARLAESGMLRPDPLRESIGLELDFINIFVRLVTILGNQQRKK